MSINYKDGYVSVEEFKANRPDLSVHSENAIQAAIYQACAILNSHTDGKIKAVWDYNNNTENIETTNSLYRTANELEYISEAIILQTQYIINLGNDLTIGSSSYSLSGATYSDSVPASREVIAPGVDQILYKAKVYDFFAMGTGEDTPDGVGGVFIPDKTCYNKFTIAQLDARYQLAHPILSDAQGKIATIQQGDGTTTSIVWTDPPTVDLQNYYTMSQVNDVIQSFWNTNITPYAGINWCNSTFVKQNDYNQKIQTIDTTLQNNYNSIYSNTTSINSLNNRVTTLENQTGIGIDFSKYITQNQLQEKLANYLTNNQAYNLTNTSDTFTINVATGSANYIELERNGTRKANFGMGSSSSDDFLLQSVGNIKILPGSGKNINVSGYRITNAGTPTSSSDVATKQYVDNAVAAGGGSGGGGTTPDLSNYVTTTQLNDALTNYVSNSNLTTQLANYLTTTNANNNYVSKTQPITLGAARDKPVKISGGTKNPVFVEFVRNNTNMGYIGLGSGNNNNINIGARSGNLCLEVPSGNSVMVNNSTIQGVADPVNATDAANKQYVDNAIANVPNNNPDLSNYVTQTGLNNALNNYALKTSLSSYVTTNTLNNTLSSYAKTSSVNQANSQAQTALTNANNALNQVTSKQDKIGSTVSNYVLYTQSFYNNVAIGSSYTAFFTVTCTLPNSSYKPINVSLWVNNSTSSTSRAFKIIQWRPVANQVNIRIERSTSNATLGVKELYIRVVGANANMFNYWDATDGSTTTPSPISLARTNDVVEEDEKVIKLVPVEGTY